MKLQQIVIASGLLAIAITANASSPLPQRNCAGDIHFTPNIDGIEDVTCTWDKLQNSAIMSLTTHFEDSSIKYVEVHCRFYPAPADIANLFYKRSRLTQVSPSTASRFTELDLNSDLDLVRFNMYYTGTNPDKTSVDDNANIIFYLNNIENYSWWKPWPWGMKWEPSYNDHDQIVCNFEIIR